MTGPSIILGAVSSSLLGLAFAWAAWLLVSFRTNRDEDVDRSWELEFSRRQKLRGASGFYRWFEPVVEEWAAWWEKRSPARLEQIGRDIRTTTSIPWKAGELVATRHIQGALLGLAVLFSTVVMGAPMRGAAVAAALTIGFPWLMLRTVADRANRRRVALRGRLPVAVDLIALMVEAGAGFVDSLKTVADEQAGHPIGDEFSAVCRDMSLGRTRAEALSDMATRVSDENVREFVFAVNKGEELGTPITTILRTQASQMRLRRSQWTEKASAEAQVYMVFPGMIIMIACLLIVAAPFLLPLIGQ